MYPLLFLATGALALYPGTDVTQSDRAKITASTYAIPESLNVEHEELEADLAAAIKLGGRTGAAAKTVERVLAQHLVKEKAFVLVPLGLLKPLADGRATPDMLPIAKMAVSLKPDWPQMLKEHQAIVNALDALASAARAEQHQTAQQFTEKAKLHMRHEEEVLYPAAILAGEFLMLKMQR